MSVICSLHNATVIKTWEERKAHSNNQWPDDECMKDEIKDLRAEYDDLKEELLRVKRMWHEDYTLLDEVCRLANSLENELRLLQEKENGQ